MSHRFLLLLPSLWPAVLVWLLIVFPSLAFSLGKTPELGEYLGFPLSIFKLCRRVWPYTKCYRLGLRIRAHDDHRDWMRGGCPTCHQMRRGYKPISLDHALQHLLTDEMAAWDVGERAWWTPPAFDTSEEADAWFDSRQNARVRGYELVERHGLVYATDSFGRLLDGTT